MPLSNCLQSVRTVAKADFGERRIPAWSEPGATGVWCPRCFGICRSCGRIVSCSCPGWHHGMRDRLGNRTAAALNATIASSYRSVRATQGDHDQGWQSRTVQPTLPAYDLPGFRSCQRCPRTPSGTTSTGGFDRGGACPCRRGPTRRPDLPCQVRHVGTEQPALHNVGGKPGHGKPPACCCRPSQG